MDYAQAPYIYHYLKKKHTYFYSCYFLNINNIYLFIINSDNKQLCRHT